MKKTNVGWLIVYTLALISFIAFMLWAFDDNDCARRIFIFSFLAQIYGILTMESKKKT